MSAAPEPSLQQKIADAISARAKECLLQSNPFMYHPDVARVNGLLHSILTTLAEEIAKIP